MANLVVQISKYVLLALLAFFTIATFLVLRRRDEAARRRIMMNQIVLMLLFNVAGYTVLFVKSEDPQMLVMLGSVIGYLVIVQVLYRLIYRKASLILLNTMCMLLCIGFLIQTRLGLEAAKKQFIIAAMATLICFIIPVFVRRVRWVSKLTWLYGIVGGVLLLGVLVLGRVSGGANLALTIGGVSFAFSEFVKITFVLYLAGMLQERHDVRTVMVATVVAAAHVGILALSADLGAALVYFVAYIVMVFTATRNPGYAALGLGGAAGASVLAYKLFAHVRVRVQVWKDPFSDYEATGYQVAQALFGIAAGGWFGTGLMNGHPDMIPLVFEDFTFAAICEEFGILFAVCMIVLCMGMYLLIVNIALRMDRPFYRLIAMGLGTEYAFQVFLTVGGNIKFIPMTGITLPLVSYGGSSLMCTIIMISIIQGLYIMRKDEDEAQQQRAEAQREALRRARMAQRAGQERRGGVRRMTERMTERFGAARRPQQTAPEAYRDRQVAPDVYRDRQSAPEAYRDRQTAPEAYRDRQVAPDVHRGQKGPQTPPLAGGAYGRREADDLERKIEEQARQDLALRSR